MTADRWIDDRMVEDVTHPHDCTCRGCARENADPERMIR